ncbi:MAG: hypothetical protein K1X49_08455 [Saprospiraceae bacterium]|nr:hypothetical protein [Saprospiraceae bacterium]
MDSGTHFVLQTSVRVSFGSVRGVGSLRNFDMRPVSEHQKDYSQGSAKNNSPELSRNGLKLSLETQNLDKNSYH